MKKSFVFVMFIVLFLSFILATQSVSAVYTGANGSVNNSMNGTEGEFEIQIMASQEKGNLEVEKMARERKREMFEEGNEIRVQIREQNKEQFREVRLEKVQNKVQLRAGNVSVNCSENCEFNESENNSKIMQRLSNGRNAEIKVMPDTASEKALERLRLKVCNEEDNCTLELKEVSVKGDKERNATLAYELKRERKAKVFGLFNSKMDVEAQVDAETGEVIKVNKPWWAFLASEPEESEEN